MPKKKPIENLDEPLDSSPEETKPVKTARKIFKDNKPPVVYTDAESSGDTVPVIARRSAKKSQTAEINTQDANLESEQLVGVTKPAKVRRAKWVWLGILIMLVITAIGAGIGYNAALKARMEAETNQRLTLATTSFVKAEHDIANGDLNMASQRLQYIMTIYPDYPGLEDKLREVLMAIAVANPNGSAAQPTPDAAFTPVATQNTSEVSVLLPQAQNQLASNDWKGLLDTINKIRNIDPGYEALKVDGLYYFALRNNGIAQIQSGHLEVGLYYFSMASKIAPLDKDTLEWTNWARMFLEAGSWYGIDFQKATDLFRDVAQQVPNMVDISGFTAKQRYVGSMEGLGDALMKALDYCNAATQYSTAKDILSSDELIAKLQQAQDYCSNPPPPPTPTLDPSLPQPTATPDSYQPNDGG